MNMDVKNRIINYLETGTEDSVSRDCKKSFSLKPRSKLKIQTRKGPVIYDSAGVKWAAVEQ